MCLPKGPCISAQGIESAYWDWRPLTPVSHVPGWTRAPEPGGRGVGALGAEEQVASEESSPARRPPRRASCTWQDTRNSRGKRAESSTRHGLRLSPCWTGRGRYPGRPSYSRAGPTAGPPHGFRVRRASRINSRSCANASARELSVSLATRREYSRARYMGGYPRSQKRLKRTRDLSKCDPQIPGRPASRGIRPRSS